MTENYQLHIARWGGFFSQNIKVDTILKDFEK